MSDIAKIAAKLSDIQRAALLTCVCIGTAEAVDLGEAGLIDEMTSTPLALDPREIWDIQLSPLGIAVRATLEVKP
jgi:hypothetical protein